jgi:hypothetical protein
MSRWFISHASLDRAFVENELLGLFKALGQEAWYAREDIIAPVDWERAIMAGLELSDWFVLVMSPRSAASEWVKREVAEWATRHRLERIIPLVIEPCDPAAFHEHLPRVQYVDFSADTTRGRNQLIALVVDILNGRAISGRWKGKIRQHQPVEGVPPELPLEISVAVRSNTVVGSGRLGAPEHGPDVQGEFTLNGVIHYARFLQVNYVVKDPGRIQFGCVMLEIDPRGKKMEGKLVGFGAASQRIVTADAMIEKVT